MLEVFDPWLDRARALLVEPNRLNEFIPIAVKALIAFMVGFSLCWAVVVTLVPLSWIGAPWQPLFVFAASVYAGVETVLHYMGWFGRRIRPRLWGWWALALLSFGIVGVLLAASTIADLARLNEMLQATRTLNAAPQTPANLARLAAVTQDSKATFFRLYLDAFAMAAGGALVVLRPMPAGWASFRRFQAFLFALVILIGRPAAGAVFDILAEQTPSLGLDVLRLVLGPLLLAIGGLLTLLPCIVLAGVLAVIAVFVFVTLPLKVYDYIQLREQNATIRAHKKAGLEHYLRRFDAWLRHKPMPFVPDESKGARFALPEEIAQVANALLCRMTP